METRILPLIIMRLEANMTQEEIGKKIGVHRTQISRLENGRFKTQPKPKTIHALSKLSKKKYQQVEKWFIKNP